MGDIAQVEIRAAVDQFRTDMAAAGASFRQVMAGMGTDALAVRAPLEQHHGLISTLSEKLREHRTEHVQTSRAVASFTKELDGLFGKGNEVAGMFASLAGGLAIGGGFGLAIEAVKVGFELIKSRGEEAKKSLEEFAKEAEKSLKAAAQWAKSAADELLRVKGFDPSLVDKAKELLAVQREIDALKLKSKTSAIGGLTEEEYDKLQALKKQYAELKEQITKYQEAKRETGEIKTEQAAEVAAEKAKAQAAAEAAREKARAEAEAERARQQALAARERLEEQFRQKDIKATEWTEQQKVKAMDDAAQRAAKIIADQERAEADAAAEEQRRIEAQRKALERLGTEIARSFAQGFTQALFHARSFQDAMSSILDGLLSMAQRLVEQAVEKFLAGKIVELLGAKAAALSETQGNIAVAVSGAAASQASIPFVGPGLAAAAAAEMLGTLEAMTAPLLAARGGFDVPTGMSPIVRLHEEERVLPADIANPMRRFFSEGGGNGSGGPIHVTIQALDGASVYRVLKDNETGVARFLREAVAGGRV
jgi:chemotaxis protein histidine kinase CheA